MAGVLPGCVMRSVPLPTMENPDEPFCHYRRSYRALASARNSGSGPVETPGIRRPEPGLGGQFRGHRRGSEISHAVAIGLAVGIPVSEGLNLQLGASYSQKGFGLGAEGFGEVTTEIDYLELTALVSKPFPVGDRASAYLLAGPALALKLSCQFAGTEPGRQRPGQLFHQPGRHRPGQLVHQEPGADAAGGLGLLDRLRAGL